MSMARHNLDVLHDVNLTPEQKREQMHEVKVTIDENQGKTFHELIADMVKDIRAHQPKPDNQPTQVFYRK